MSGHNPRRTNEEWERIFEMKREIEAVTEWHTLADVMAREKSPYITGQATGINRAERRKWEAKNRRAK